MERTFTALFEESGSFDGSLSPEFAKAHVFVPLQKLVEFHTPPGTELLAILQSKSVVAGEQTPRVHCELRTPFSTASPVTEGFLKQSIADNMPGHCSELTLAYSPTTSSFKWSVDFQFDKKTRAALEATDKHGSSSTTAVGTANAQESIPLVNVEDKDALLQRRRDLEHQSKVAEIVQRKNRTRRDAQTVLGKRDGYSPVALTADSERNSSVRPAKRLVVPRRAAPKAPIGIAKAAKKSRAHAKTGSPAMNDDDDDEEEPTASAGNGFFKRILCFVAGVDAKHETSSDYATRHQYDTDLFVQK
jgi:hypothetical protein